MTTPHPVAAPPEHVQPAPPAASAQIVPEKIVLPTEDMVNRGTMDLDSAPARLPVELDVCIPVPDFRVRNLLALEAGSIVESDWTHGDDVPIASGDVQLAWSEFEVVDTQLAVRVTRLA